MFKTLQIFFYFGIKIIETCIKHNPLMLRQKYSHCTMCFTSLYSSINFLCIDLDINIVSVKNVSPSLQYTSIAHRGTEF
jgi:hypothetical protein